MQPKSKMEEAFPLQKHNCKIKPFAESFFNFMPYATTKAAINLTPTHLSQIFLVQK